MQRDIQALWINKRRGNKMNATQQNFHPMRGHIADGNTILCDDGEVLTISNTIHGWKLTNKKGEQVGRPTHDGGQLTQYVIRYGQ